uniref:Uncharacterized protein n=1 Tax=Arundo donax TaxID=35708 RepID=A0A0A9E101_ARUDO
MLMGNTVACVSCTLEYAIMDKLLKYLCFDLFFSLYKLLNASSCSSCRSSSRHRHFSTK